MSDVSAGSPSWGYSEGDSVQSASARSTAPSYMPPHAASASRYFSFRTAVIGGGSAQTALSSTASTAGASASPRLSVVVGAGDVDSEVDGGRGEEKRVQDGVAALERHPDFMRFFFEHLTGCPPHGPFRYYAALTLVQRARQRYGLDGSHLSARPHSGSDGRVMGEAGTLSLEDDAMLQTDPSTDHATASPSSAATSAMPTVGYCISVDVLREALTITNVLALMEACFDTRHLKSWELLYVPAEVRSTDIEALLDAKRKRRQSLAAKKPAD